MYFRPRLRPRSGMYPLAQENAFPRWARLLISAGAVILALYLAWELIIRVLGLTSSIERAGATVALENRGSVNVTIEGKSQKAEHGMLIFADESIATSGGARAQLEFFDGTRARLDENTTVNIEESGRGTPESSLILTQTSGRMWLQTPEMQSFSGSIARTVKTQSLRFSISSGTEALLSDGGVEVFSSEHEGVTVTADGETFIISEGQRWTKPEDGELGNNPFAFRSPLEAAPPAFVTESRRSVTGSSAATPAPRENTELLTVLSPQNDAVISESVVTVQGTVGDGVTFVMVNGYPAMMDLQRKTFRQQVDPPDGEGDFEISVQALDAQRNTIAEARRTIKRPALAPVGTPTVTVPAQTGQTYRTLQEEVILRGTAPAGAAGIIVNDYRLQLFDPAKGEWSYIASIRLENMRRGTNTYDVIAIDGSGRRSTSARITIIQGEGPEGVVSPGASSASSAAPVLNNDPLLPGSLTVTAPTAGTSHVATGTGFLIEGTTSAQTASISVNDYTLQLYKPGVTTWNYIAEERLNNLKPGTNTYVIVARNSKGEILDRLTYSVEYTPPSP